MRRTFTGISRWILLSAITLGSVISCTVRKRLFTKGYAVEWHTQFKAHREKSESAVLYEPERIVPLTDTVSVDRFSEPVPCRPAEEKVDPRSVNTALSSLDQTATLRKKSVAPREERQSKAETIHRSEKPKPPKETTRENGALYLEIAFELTGYAVILLAGGFLFLFLANVITVVFFEYFFGILAVVAFGLTGYLIGYVLVSFLCAAIYLLVYYIHKWIYKRRTRFDDEESPFP